MSAVPKAATHEETVRVLFPDGEEGLYARQCADYESLEFEATADGSLSIHRRRLHEYGETLYRLKVFAPGTWLMAEKLPL